jgi:hypothetical protein
MYKWLIPCQQLILCNLKAKYSVITPTIKKIPRYKTTLFKCIIHNPDKTDYFHYYLEQKLLRQPHKCPTHPQFNVVWMTEKRKFNPLFPTSIMWAGGGRRTFKWSKTWKVSLFLHAIDQEQKLFRQPHKYPLTPNSVLCEWLKRENSTHFFQRWSWG